MFSNLKFEEDKKIVDKVFEDKEILQIKKVSIQSRIS
jgi:hypothetical protein